MTVWARLNPEPAWLDGPSANPYWNVPLTLHSLCGEIEAADILIHAHDPLMNIRLAGIKETTKELGIATTCVVVTSLVAEKAIKTLIAQTNPQERPRRSHKLSELFREELDPAEQDAVQRQYEALPSFWDHYVESFAVEDVLGIVSDNFEDWRYATEPGGAQGGLPKPLLKVAVAVTLVGFKRLTQWQVANGIYAPKAVSR